jgi:prepilin-type N-terminal cleavage/methylation domain-containing protein
MLNRLRKRIHRNEKGFTLIELLVVVIILGILTAIAIPSYLSFKGRANDAAAKANVRSILPSIESYFADNNTYVGMTLSGLQASYDQALNVASYTLPTTLLTSSSYCVQSTSGSSTWKKAGPAAQIATGIC